jgi:hypothetical protein
MGNCEISKGHLDEQCLQSQEEPLALQPIGKSFKSRGRNGFLTYLGHLEVSQRDGLFLECRLEHRVSRDSKFDPV